ncbi:enoyl-CoA hydratase/isomerase family protein [Roseomonas eburnea]|uniref:Enoyl-CoA hydratase/isomerase family protein n=1 Tax=Neoroseomonas eburnea TaxID=1346889 RepID=A0A9X9X6D5_9PROT|nr:enoyl-CoA hydratase-related protein [Neoroseomonas eburnea]MBR0679271.1 enoyl-CoA hydratase/isomerase family protein [Neoroseomonas eburnea]
MSEAETPVLLTLDGAVARLVLNRPQRRNAMNSAMGEALDAALDALEADRESRVLLLCGAGGHFCAGLDLGEVGSQESEAERLAAAQERNRKIGERYRRLCALPKVVVAAVQGAAHAGGLGWVCAADIAIASADARFCAPETLRGLVPAQILPWLVRRMGRSAATRLVLRADVIDAAEALRLGLVHQVAADAAGLEAAVEAVLADIRKGAPSAIAETKALIAALGPLAPEGYAEAGALAFARCAAGEEAREGIAAFQQKRPPRWAS